MYARPSRGPGRRTEISHGGHGDVFDATLVLRPAGRGPSVAENLITQRTLMDGTLT